jgi:hypothetical protein
MTADKRLQPTRPSPRERQPPARPPSASSRDLQVFATPAPRVELAGSTG